MIDGIVWAGFLILFYIILYFCFGHYTNREKKRQVTGEHTEGKLVPPYSNSTNRIISLDNK